MCVCEVNSGDGLPLSPTAVSSLRSNPGVCEEVGRLGEYES